MLSTAGGTELPLCRKTVVQLEISGHRIQCRVVVLDAITELILGIECMQINQCVWDFGSNSFVIQGQKKNIRSKKFEAARVRRLVTSLNEGRVNWDVTSKVRDQWLLLASVICSRKNNIYYFQKHDC